MKPSHQPGLADRFTTSAEAKKALLAKFKPKPTVTAPEGALDRAARIAAEKEAVRQARLAEKEAAAKAKAEAEAARREALLNDEQAQLELKRQERKDRKAAAKAEARAKRESKRR